MNIIEIIHKKVTKKILSKEELEFFIMGYVNGKVPDYQMSSLLMAIKLNGMTIQETVDLTMILMNSGDVIDLSSIKGIKVDKHSTGGIGDKTSLVLCPILASLGFVVAKISGRGLNFTGGTLDKLESIPGFNVEKTQADFLKLIKENGIAIISQSEKLVPADKKLYALRDVTGTVESIPLIASSIMSKKLATSSDIILLDVKVGNATFMKDLDSAKKLAETMVSIGKLLNKKVKVKITNMNRPIGRSIGNKNEVLEAVETLKGYGPKDFVELIISLGTAVLSQIGISEEAKARSMIKKVIANGSALNKFYEMVEAQGGDSSAIEKPNFISAKYIYEIKSYKSGFMEITSAIDLGIVSMKLGAGRQVKEQELDFSAGIYINKKTNEVVQNGDVLFTLYSNTKIKDSFISQVIKAYKINKYKVNNSIIIDEID